MLNTMNKRAYVALIVVGVVLVAPYLLGNAFATALTLMFLTPACATSLILWGLWGVFLKKPDAGSASSQPTTDR